MLFNTYTYALFLPLVLALYLALPLRGRQILLLAASYVFYCWETPVYGLLLLFSTCLDFVCGWRLGKTDRPAPRRLILLCSIVGNLFMLGFFKYADFFGENIYGIGRLFGCDTHWAPFDFILPIGISFYTFQTMSYTIQVYKRQIEPTHDALSFGLYVAFFPQLVAGPIERATHLLPQLQTYHRVTIEDFTAGTTRIIFGLFRKIVIADRLAILVDVYFQNPDKFSTLTAWVVMAAFGGQIYFDFAGYSDIAIGSARLLGIRLTENFRRPLMSRSVADFWTRWHITLTSWLRDYVFYTLGGFKKGGIRAFVNGWVVLLLVGLWHGAAWHFLLWGVYQATLVSLYYIWKFLKKKMGVRPRPKRGAFSLSLLFAIALTYFFNCGNTIFFRSPDVATMGHITRALLGRHGGAGLETQWVVLPFLAMILAFLVIEFSQEFLALNERIKKLPWLVRLLGMAIVVLVLVLTCVNNQNPYIYFQF